MIMSFLIISFKKHASNKTCQPHNITAHWLVLIFRPAEGRGLSWLLISLWRSCTGDKDAGSSRDAVRRVLATTARVYDGH